MRARWISIIRSMVAVAGGYAVIVIGTSLTFGTFGNVHVDSPPETQIIGSIGAVISGLLGGAFAAFVAPHHRWLHAAAVLIFLVIDTTYVLMNFPGPWWFDLIGSLTLMITTLAGGWMVSNCVQRRVAARGDGVGDQPSPGGRWQAEGRVSGGPQKRRHSDWTRPSGDVMSR